MIQLALIISSLGIGVIWGSFAVVTVTFLSEQINDMLLYTIYLPGRIGVFFLQWNDLLALLVSICTATLIIYLLLRFFAQLLKKLLKRTIPDRKVI